MDSLAITISKPFAIKQCLEAIGNARPPMNRLKLVLIVDSDDKDLQYSCLEWAKKGEWRDVIVKMNDRDPIKESDLKNAEKKWGRIIDNMEKIKVFEIII